MLERLLPREDVIADKAFSRRRTLPADDEYLRIAFIRKDAHAVLAFSFLEMLRQAPAG